MGRFTHDLALKDVCSVLCVSYSFLSLNSMEWLAVPILFKWDTVFVESLDWAKG